MQLISLVLLVQKFKHQELVNKIISYASIINLYVIS